MLYGANSGLRNGLMAQFFNPPDTAVNEKQKENI